MNENLVRTQLKKQLLAGEAFINLEDLLKKVSFGQISIRPENLPYSIYEQFYHIRFTQKDILDFIKNEDYTAPKWPDDYWPENQHPENEGEWKELQQSFFKERQELLDIIDKKSDFPLDKIVKNGTNQEQSLLREILLVIQHNAYHTGQLLILLRLLEVYE